ncbi:MAG: translocation/assembly module TamB domain-containing protein [Acidobacteria bacterium]|nr:translocation/assembly module TamB domain-containing protein [Acidobacteriota bacterium]
MRIRRRAILITLPALAGVLVIITGSVLWYLQTDSFSALLRSEVLLRLRSGTGMDVGLDELRVDLLRRRFLIRGLTLSPRPGSRGTFRLSLDEARGSFRVGRLIHPKPRISDLVLVRPHISLLTGTGGGWNPEGFLKVFRRSLDFAAAKVDVQEGWVEVDNRRVPFSVALEDLVCDIRFREAPERYDVELSYKNSRFLWAGRDIVYDLETRMSVSMAGIEFTSLGIRHKASLLAGSGSLKNWRSAVLTLRLAGPVEARDMTLFHSALEEAGGRTDAVVNVTWDSKGFRASGTFSAAAGEYRTVQFAGLKGTFEYERDVLTLRKVSARLGEGSVRADGAFYLGRRPVPHRFRFEAESAPLEKAAVLLNIPEISFENSVDSRAVVAWRSGIRDLSFEGTVAVHGLPMGDSHDQRRIALDGSADVGYERGIWRVSKADFQSSATSITASGSGDSVFRVRLVTARVAEPIAILRAFSSDLRGLVRAEPGIVEATGRLELDGLVRLLPSGPATYEGGLAVENGCWRSYRTDRLDAHATWDGSTLTLRSMKARLGKQTVEGDLAVQTPAGGDDQARLQFGGKLRDVSLSSLSEFGIDVMPDLGGTLSGDGSAVYADGQWTGHGALEVRDLRVAEQQFDGLNARVKLDARVLEVLQGEIRRGSALLRFKGNVERPDQVMKLSVGLEGLPLREIRGSGGDGPPIDGYLSASGELSGKPGNPSFDGNFQLRNLRYSSWDLGEGSGTLKLVERMLELRGSVRSEFGSLEGQARISTDSGFPGHASLDLRDWNVQKLVPADTPRLLSDLSTALQGKLDVEGRFAEPSTLKLRAELDGARLKIRGYEFRNSGRIRFTVANKRLKIEEAKIVGDGSDFTLGGEIPVGEDYGLDLRLAGDLNLRIMDRIVEKLRVSGSSRLDVHASGSRSDPEVIGQADLNGAQFDYGDLPFNFTSVQGRFVFSRNIARLESVRGNMASGSFEVTGITELRAGEFRSANLRMTVRRVRLPFPRGFRTTFDANLNLAASPESQVLSGDVNVTRAEYLRPLSVFEQFAAGAAGPSSGVMDPLLAQLRLNLELQSSRGLVIDDEAIKLTAGFRLRLRGTPEYPSLLGRIEADEGSVLFRGNRFEFVYARADFFDRNQINPVLDARAEVDLKSYRLILDAKGPLDKLTVNLSSDPPLSTVDAVSLLTTGTTGTAGDGTSRGEAEVAGISAAGLLSEGLTGGLTKQVERVFGFQSFRVDPFLAGADKDPTARVTITQRLSKDLRVTFSRNLSKTEEQIVILEYDLTRNISIVAIQDERGGFGLDFRFRRRFR